MVGSESMVGREGMVAPEQERLECSYVAGRYLLCHVLVFPVLVFPGVSWKNQHVLPGLLMAPGKPVRDQVAQVSIKIVSLPHQHHD